MKIVKLYLLLTVLLGAINLTLSLNTAKAEALPIESASKTTTVAPVVAPDPNDFCKYTAPEKEVFSAKIITIRKKLRVAPGERFRVKVFLKNTGTTPWFSKNSNCSKPVMSLGTESPKDRTSLLRPTTIEAENNWKEPGRIYMDQLRTDPGEISSFTFWAIAPKHEDGLREFFAPVIEGVTWLNESKFSFDLYVGTLNETAKDLGTKMSLLNESGSILGIDLSAPRMITVDVSEQNMYISLGDKIVKVLRTSTGKASTPTPYGETKILLKQEVRVGHAAPHYIMPKFLMFRAGGYGIHALPSLAHDRGVFWTEARNHIGRPVSHGCIRLLPEDADFLFDFIPVGAKVVVRP